MWEVSEAFGERQKLSETTSQESKTKRQQQEETREYTGVPELRHGAVAECAAVRECIAHAAGNHANDDCPEHDEWDPPPLDDTTTG